MKRHLSFAALGIASFAITSATVLLAKNQWSCWHWSKDTIAVETLVGGYWGTVISSEFNDWDSGTCVTFGNGGEIHGDANFYGNTGWLGLARLLTYDAGACEILEAEALMNQSYLDGASYDEIDDRHVTCQEIGHTLGLDHRKGPRNRTCMNDQTLGWDFFDGHDAGVIADITGGANCAGGGSGGDPCAGGNEKGKKKCNDGIDNDGDGCIDADDPDCN